MTGSSCTGCASSSSATPKASEAEARRSGDDREHLVPVGGGVVVRAQVQPGHVVAEPEARQLVGEIVGDATREHEGGGRLAGAMRPGEVGLELRAADIARKL